ncbi:MAG TPA: aminotransferase class V-fold PLP-dependent enzyme, partial [Gammaproteobacteria bacterium]|nr:aminotransferase class V-fold PLP-dependent enzyme [Gammaproteobacteria bacterium]
MRRALAGPDICHRENEFSALLRRVRRNLLKAFRAGRTHTAALLTGSGTLAVEAMLASYGAAPGRKVLVLSNGVYGERMRDMLAAHRVPHAVLAAPLGHFPSSATIATALSDPAVTAVALVHHETSTGMLNPLEDVARLAKKHGKALLVDAVSSLGAERLDVASVDFLAGSAGKCLHGHPGLSFVLVSKEQAARLERAASVYMDLREILASEDKDAPPFTPAVPLVYSFDAALSELLNETAAGRARAYRAKSALLEKGLEALGLRFLVEKKHRSHVLTTVWLPRGVTYARLHARLKRKGFVIYAGQSALKEHVFRVSNLGGVTAADLRRFLK